MTTIPNPLPKLRWKSRAKISQVFVLGRGWLELAKDMPLRQLHWRKTAAKFRGWTRVRFVDFGDYSREELRRNAGLPAES